MAEEFEKFRIELDVTSEEYQEIMQRLDRMHSQKENRYHNFFDLKLFDFIAGKLRDALKIVYDGTDWRNCPQCEVSWPHPSVTSNMKCPHCSTAAHLDRIAHEKIVNQLMERWSLDLSIPVGLPLRKLANQAAEEVQKMLGRTAKSDSV